MLDSWGEWTCTPPENLKAGHYFGDVGVYFNVYPKERSCGSVNWIHLVLDMAQQ
jgi:hypothetical protein